jgi:hypothetical protein
MFAFRCRARMCAAADFLERRVQLSGGAFRRGCPEVPATGRGGDLTELLRACLPALQVCRRTKSSLSATDAATGDRQRRAHPGRPAAAGAA